MDISPARRAPRAPAPPAQTVDDSLGSYVDYVELMAAGKTWHAALGECLRPKASLAFTFNYQPPPRPHPPPPMSVGQVVLEIFKEFQKPPAEQREHIALFPGIYIFNARFDNMLRAQDPSFFVCVLPR